MIDTNRLITELKYLMKVIIGPEPLTVEVQKDYIDPGDEAISIGGGQYMLYTTKDGQWGVDTPHYSFGNRDTPPDCDVHEHGPYGSLYLAVQEMVKLIQADAADVAMQGFMIPED